MKSLLSICALAGILMLGDAAAERWTDSNLAAAQSTTSACYQNCTNVRRWPSAQCAQYCRSKSRQR